MSQETFRDCFDRLSDEMIEETSWMDEYRQAEKEKWAVFSTVQKLAYVLVLTQELLGTSQRGVFIALGVSAVGLVTIFWLMCQIVSYLL